MAEAAALMVLCCHEDQHFVLTACINRVFAGVQNYQQAGQKHRNKLITPLKT